MKPLLLITILFITSCMSKEEAKQAAEQIPTIQTQPIPFNDSAANKSTLSEHPIEQTLTNCISSSSNVVQCCQEYYDSWNKEVIEKYNAVYSKAKDKNLLLQWHKQYTLTQKLYSNLLAELNKDLGQSMFENRLLEMGKSLSYQYDLLLNIEAYVNN